MSGPPSSVAAPRRRVAIVAGARTPFAKAGTVLRARSAMDLALHAVRGLLERARVAPGELDALAFGIVVLNPRLPHLAREVALAIGAPTTRALTLTDNCITGASAISQLAGEIARGRAEVALAGGVESMSNPALALSTRAARALLDARAARSLSARLGALGRLRPRDLLPEAPGAVEPSTGLTMGEHCELMVKEWGVGRAEQDEIALLSHRRAHAATEDGRLTAEIVPLDGLARDTLVRADTSAERLAALPPVFDRSATGTITAGNSSPLTDGAAALLLMSEERAHAEGREPLAFVEDAEFVGIAPAEGLLMGPAVAVPRLLRRNGLALAELDVVEMHEAFGGQVVCNLRAWERGWKEPAIGTVDPERRNPLGSSIAVGHPFAATGIRIATTLANELRRRGARRGLMSICGAGGTASATLLTRD